MPHCSRALLVPALVLAALLALTIAAPAVQHHVGSGQTYSTIKSAMIAAADGDTITVHAGTYMGADNRNLNPAGRNLVFWAVSGPDSTVIDAELSNYRVFTFSTGETSSTVVTGFTIQNAYYPSNGGAILCSGTSPRIENCHFTGCQSNSNGGAIEITNDSAATISNCEFYMNEAPYRGGAIHTADGSVTITQCLFTDNYLTIGTGGGAIWFQGSGETVTNCTFVANSGLGNGQIATYVVSDLTISNCIIAHTPFDPPIYVANAGTATITHSCIYANANGDSLTIDHHDNLFTAPLFCDRMGGNYRLCEDSPCLASMNPWAELIGSEWEGCGSCGTAVEPTSWGRMKALFRR